MKRNNKLQRKTHRSTNSLRNSPFNIILFTGGIALLIIIFGYIYLNNQKENYQNNSNSYQIKTGQQSTTTSKEITCPTYEKFNDWKTYANTKFNYCISYPEGWTHGDEQDNPSYLAAPGGEKSYGNSDIGIRIGKKITGNYSETEINNINLEEYVTKQAGNETGPEKIPLQITKIITESGLIGYRVKWEANGWTQDKNTYSTYFAIPNDKSLTLQFEGMDDHHVDIYDQVIQTLSFTE